MSTFSEAATEHPPRRPCILGMYINTHPEGPAIQQALDDGWTAARIHRGLRGIGSTIAYSTVQRHRQGMCICPDS